ncbi:MAG: pantoate--beta-alanine ligase [Planctomycetes bacterium]|nr:pantoate--beta-alanine ligase [Planctomycetota bacterium]
MRVIEGLEEAAGLCDRWRAAGLGVGLVPTMGALHEGHASLLRRARAECDRVAASIFVNPTQFGPGEDLAAYPRTRDADVALCEGAGVDLAFFARAEEVYPEGFQTWVTVEHIARPLCGASRPVHFRGVATVVTQLLAIVRPHRAYFGAKDYQQSRVVARLARDLHLGVEIRVCDAVREPDGLAMSSRNRHLSLPERAVAPRIYRALVAARDLVLTGEARVGRVLERLHEVLEPGPELRIDYAEVRDAEDLRELPGGRIARGAGVLIAVAAFVGNTRLIDNVVIPPDPRA